MTTVYPVSCQARLDKMYCIAALLILSKEVNTHLYCLISLEVRREADKVHRGRAGVER
jgi:hypothetical protein